MGYWRMWSALGLESDPKEDYEARLSHLCQNIHLGLETLLNDLDPYPLFEWV